ncbi:MAG: DUF2085 domain-containing protein [Chloroflexi bacterium]|nr:DUF2085 domain-containing protein [Chloroflexota bacterium]MBP8057204.1 DUF2085 domain-containing protein [Chloroflexota bacterium]
MNDSMLALPWQKPQNRRWLVAGIVMLTLVVMGFYTITNPERLAGSMLLGGADVAGYAFCHRITDRSFTIGGRQFPLCARCTGMYLGVMLTFVVLFLAGRWRWSQLPPFKIMLSLVGLVALMGIDGLNSYSHFFPDVPHLYTPQNWLRLLTGLGTGLAMGAFVFPALAQTLWHEQVWQPAIGSWRELFDLVVVVLAAALLIFSNQPVILYVLGLASAAGLLITIMTLNTMILLIVTRRDARMMTWRQATIPLIIGLVLAVGQISLIAFVRFQLTGTWTGFPGLT